MGMSYDGVTEVALKDGGSVSVRRLRASQVNKLARRAGLVQGNTASEMEFGYLLARAAIVGCEGVKDEAGEPLKFSTVSDPVMGKICDERVTDAISGEDRTAIVEAIFGPPERREETRGN